MRPSGTKDWAAHSPIAPQHVSHLCCPLSLSQLCYFPKENTQSQTMYKNNLFLLIIRNINFYNNISNNDLEFQAQSFSIHLYKSHLS